MVRPPKVTPVTPGWFRILRSSPSRNGIEHHWIHVAVWIYDTLHGTYNIFICILSSYNYLTFILCFLKYRNRLYVSICCMQIIIYICCPLFFLSLIINLYIKQTILNFCCRPFILSSDVVKTFGFPSTWNDLRHFEDHPQALGMDAKGSKLQGFQGS